MAASQSAIWLRMSGVMALPASGRLSVIHATPSRSSRSTSDTATPIGERARNQLGSGLARHDERIEGHGTLAVDDERIDIELDDVRGEVHSQTLHFHENVDQRGSVGGGPTPDAAEQSCSLELVDHGHRVV